jgi:hypothetical protein
MTKVLALALLAAGCSGAPVILEEAPPDASSPVDAIADHRVGVHREAAAPDATTDAGGPDAPDGPIVDAPADALTEASCAACYSWQVCGGPTGCDAPGSCTIVGQWEIPTSMGDAHCNIGPHGGTGGEGIFVQCPVDDGGGPPVDPGPYCRNPFLGPGIPGFWCCPAPPCEGGFWKLDEAGTGGACVP